MKKCNLENIKSHPSQSLAKANASRDLQINFNQAEDALTIPAESRHDYKCGSTTQRGRSMIEMLGVLAIVGVLSVGGIAGYSKAMMEYRINKTIEQITLIAGNVRTFFAPQGNYDGLSSYSETGKAIIKKAKLVPDEMWDSNNINDVWGNSFYLVSANKSASDGQDKKSFEISFLNLPVEACIKLASKDWSDAGINAIWWGGVMEDKIKFSPVDIATATDLCSSPSFSFNDAVTTLAFYFDVDTSSTYWINRSNW